MYVMTNRDRWLNVTIAVLLLLIIIALLKYDNYTFALWDTRLQTAIVGHGASWLNHLISALTGAIVCGIYAVLLWFFLWGFKHKLIATWLLSTYLLGQVWFVLIRRWVARPRPAAHPHALTTTSFPSHHVFAVVLLSTLVWVAVLPWITHNWHRWLLAIALIVVSLLTIISRIKLNAAFPMDAVGSLLLVYIWLQVAKALYLSVFARLQGRSIFRHSDFN